jgi:hypothetical protein
MRVTHRNVRRILCTFFYIWINIRVHRNDYGSKPREGNRVVGIGEKPFFDPNSVSRREASALGVKL